MNEEYDIVEVEMSFFKNTRYSYEYVELESEEGSSSMPFLYLKKAVFLDSPPPRHIRVKVTGFIED